MCDHMDVHACVCIQIIESMRDRETERARERERESEREREEVGQGEGELAPGDGRDEDAESYGPSYRASRSEGEPRFVRAATGIYPALLWCLQGFIILITHIRRLINPTYNYP